MAATTQPDATGWVPTKQDGFDIGWPQLYTDWSNRYVGAHANGAFTFNLDRVEITNGERIVTNLLTGSGWESGGVDQGFSGQRCSIHYWSTEGVALGQSVSVADPGTDWHVA